MSSIPDLKKAKIRSISNEGALHKSQLDIMNEKLSNLSQSLGSLKGEYNRLNKDRDSIKTHLDYFWPMRSLVYNAKLRDQVGGALELNPGDMALLKTDSSRVVVIDIKVGGNDLSYYLNYMVKTTKVELLEVSPYEIMKEAINE